METATSDDYISNHFQDTTLLCSLTSQKQESREMFYTNLTGLILKKPKGRYAKLIFSVETVNDNSKTEDNSKSLTQGSQIVLTKCYRNI